MKSERVHYHQILPTTAYYRAWLAIAASMLVQCIAFQLLWGLLGLVIWWVVIVAQTLGVVVLIEAKSNGQDQ